MEVFRVFLVRDGELVEDSRWPTRADSLLGDLMGVLTDPGLRKDGGGPTWQISLWIGERDSRRQVSVPLQPFLTADEYQDSNVTPFSFGRLGGRVTHSSIKSRDLNWAWLYRDGLYITERTPRPSELGEVVLRVKALHYQRDEELKRLREQVRTSRPSKPSRAVVAGRRAIPDDVKLLVWSRDKGACVKCDATRELHFDHIIPWARGGSDEAANIQLLCRTCNLSKGDRIV